MLLPIVIARAASLHVEVFDDAGLAISDATCTLEGPVSRQVASADGICRFDAVPPGRYRLSAQREGYTPRGDVAAWIADGPPTRMPISLDWGGPRFEAAGERRRGRIPLPAPPRDPDAPPRLTIVTAGSTRTSIDLDAIRADSLSDVFRLVPGGFPHGATVYVDGVRRAAAPRPLAPRSQ